MRIARRLVIIALVIVLISAILISGYAYYSVRRPLPKQEGELVVEGMKDAITIYRDTWGVPHVYAVTPYDLFFAQGFVHAQERWWQMELSRRTGHGTLSELLGENEDIQATDQLIRTLGWNQIAQAQWDRASYEVRASLQAYAAGVNAYIAERSPGDLALEYTVLDLSGGSIEIAPWTPLDSLAWGVALRWQMSGNAVNEIERAMALMRVDDMMLEYYAPLNPPASAPTILNAGDLSTAASPVPGSENTPAAATDYTRLPLDETLAGFDLLGARDTPDSSAWVVSGAFTSSGLPLLAAAPGLSIQMPSAWYEIGLYCIETSARCSYNVTGLSIPGLPTVIMGHNDTMAWAITGANIDEQDISIARLNPKNPVQYAWEDGWREMIITEDTLAVNGVEEPVPFTIYRTHLGPVIAAPAPLSGRDQALVVQWTAQDDPRDPIQSLLQLNRAQNWDDFRAALEVWGGAAANVVYADRAGYIGYQLAGQIPVRGESHSGAVPVPCEDAVWVDVLPFEDLPSVFNPLRGYIITANNPVVPSGYASGLGSDAGYRAARIEDLLLSNDAHTADTFAAIQGDVTSPFAGDILPYLLDLELEDDALADMQTWLGDWDDAFTIDSPQAALFGAFWVRLLEFTYADELGAIPCDCATTRQGLATLLAEPNHPWWDDVQTRFGVERRDAILRKAFEQAVIDLTRESGSNRDEWRWGDLHTATFTGLPNGPFDADLIQSGLDRGPVPVSGSADTINATRSGTDPEHRFEVISAPSARLIIDLDSFEASRAMHTTGQSSHLASAHYDDMIDPWRFIEYHGMLWERTSIEEASDAMLSLEPNYTFDATPTSRIE